MGRIRVQDGSLIVWFFNSTRDLHSIVLIFDYIDRCTLACLFVSRKLEALDSVITVYIIG